MPMLGNGRSEDCDSFKTSYMRRWCGRSLGVSTLQPRETMCCALRTMSMPLVFGEDGRRNDGTLFIALRGPRTAKGFHVYQRIFGSKFSPGPALNVMGSLIEHFTRIFLEEKIPVPRR